MDSRSDRRRPLVEEVPFSRSLAGVGLEKRRDSKRLKVFEYGPGRTPQACANERQTVKSQVDVLLILSHT